MSYVQPKAVKECDPSSCFARFWMVLGEPPHGITITGLPTFKHQERASADREAARLANCNPGTKFYVLEAVAACRKSDVYWLEAADQRDLPPF